jgi:DNA-binding NtrC family response regulator
MPLTNSNPMTKRKLLLVQPTNCDYEIHNGLSAHDWDVYVASDLKQASDLTNKHTFKVGLCLVDKKCSSPQCVVGKQCLIEKCSDSLHLAQLNRLFNSSGCIKWIMGLPKACSPKTDPNTPESKLIAECCYNYVTLPVDMARLLITLGHAYGMSELSQPSSENIHGYPSRFGIIGDSPAMAKLFNLIEKVAKEDCSVLIEGETGTGKELIANAIHDHSRRTKAPFVAINCGAFPKDLIQAELFGYEKGAFTGAQQRKMGCIESAQGGTLFLDEIGDLPYVQQVNLLRFLEDRTVTRIGGAEKIPVNVRVISATHVDLKDAVQNGNFRGDLYYRIRVLQLKTPPLRERGHDIEMLAYYFFNKFSANRTYKAQGFHADSLYLLKNHGWPGNVRELMNCIQHALVISETRMVTPSDLDLDRRLKERTLHTLDEARAVADRESIIVSLRHANNNMSRAAESLGISRVSLYRLVEKHNIVIKQSSLLQEEGGIVDVF